MIFQVQGWISTHTSIIGFLQCNYVQKSIKLNYCRFAKQNHYLKELLSFEQPGMPSAVVSDIKYDAATYTLRIIFLSGRVYDYKNVPQHVFNAMKASFSKGAYFNRYIKDYYEFEKIM